MCVILCLGKPCEYNLVKPAKWCNCPNERITAFTPYINCTQTIEFPLSAVSASCQEIGLPLFTASTWARKERFQPKRFVRRTPNKSHSECSKGVAGDKEPGQQARQRQLSIKDKQEPLQRKGLKRLHNHEKPIVVN